jgi:hypothetical protein
VIFHAGYKRRQVAGVVAEIGIHRDRDVIALVQGEAQSGEDGGPQAQLAGPMEHEDARISPRQLVGQVAGAVGRIVVDDKDIGRGDRLLDAAQQGFEVVALLVGGDSHQDALVPFVHTGSFRERFCEMPLASEPWPWLL